MSRTTLPISLTLTTLNEEKSIGAFLRSIAAQTIAPAEIVICDGGSKDRTVQCIQEFQSEDCEIRVFEESGSNIAAGRNAAILRARHEIIAVSDAGCVFDPDWIEKITSPLLNNDGIHIVGGGYGYLTDSLFEKIAATAEIDVDDLPTSAFLPSSRSIAFRKSAWEAVGGYPENLTFAGEDTAFCLALLKVGYRIYLERSARVFWKPRTNLFAYIRQHYLYGVGDGEARNKSRFYLNIVIKYLLLSLLLLFGFIYPLFILLIGIALIFYAHRLHKLYRWRSKPFAIWLPAFLLIAVKELSVLAGFFVGRTRWNSLHERTLGS